MKGTSSETCRNHIQENNQTWKENEASGKLGMRGKGKMPGKSGETKRRKEKI